MYGKLTGRKFATSTNFSVFSSYPGPPILNSPQKVYLHLLFQVIGAASSQAKLKVVKEMGAAHTVDYSTESIREKVRLKS